MNDLIKKLDWEKMNDLIPVIIQDHLSYQVLMLGYMNQAALEQTLATHQVTFYSRSKQRLWTKGETSSNTLEMIDISCDCDNDTLLILAKPKGPTCHLGTSSCFKEVKEQPLAILNRLIQIIENRHRHQPENSYTTKLFQSGIKRMAQKVGEEGVEVALAAIANDDTNELCQESADLLFHLLVLLRAREVTLSDITKILAERIAAKIDEE